MRWIKTLTITIITTILTLASVTQLATSAHNFTPEDIQMLNFEPEMEEAIEVKPSHVLDTIGIFGFHYVNRMSYLESRHNYKVVNRYGYMGRYQFHKKTLKSIGFTKQEIKLFLNTPALQEKAMVVLTTKNKRYMERHDLMKYIDKNIGGVNITLEGMLAGAHLRGASAVRKYLRTGGKVNLKDGNGTTVQKYMREFENIQLDLESSVTIFGV